MELLGRLMPRSQEGEWMDDPAFSPEIRAGEVAYLEALQSLMQVHRAVLAPVAAALALAPRRRIVDLCAGAGGLSLALHAALRRRGDPVELVLTDLHPQQVAPGPGRSYWPEPVDARAVPRVLDGVRTQFMALHHFDPDTLHAMFADAVAAGCPFVGLEGTSRSFGMVVGSALLTPPLALLLAPRARVPLRRLPEVAAAITRDGVVSNLRSYRTGELRAILRSAALSGWSARVEEQRWIGVKLRRVLLLPP